MRSRYRFAGVLVFVWSAAYAAEFGSLTGQVTDIRDGRPIVHAVVSTDVCGAKTATTTDEDGRFVLANLPVGSRAVRLEADGYEAVVLTGVTILSDRYVTLDCGLSDKSHGVQSERVGSENSLGGADLRQLPQSDIANVLTLWPSISWVHQNNRPGTNSPELHVRGADSYANQWLLGGQAVRDEQTGLLTASFSASAIDELTLWPGAAVPASCVFGGPATIALTEAKGGDRLSGFVQGITDNTIGSDYDQNWYSAGLSGAVRGLPTLRFYGLVERRYLGDRNPSPITEEITADGSKRLPHNWQRGWSEHGRIDWGIKPGMLLTASANYSVDDWAEYWHLWNNPDYAEQIEHSPRTRDKTVGSSIRLSHALTDKITYRLAAAYSQTQRVRGDGVLFDNYSAYQSAFPNPTWDQFYLYREGDVIWSSEIDNTIPEGSASDTIVDYTASIYSVLTKYKTATLGFKGEVKVNPAPGRELVFGADLKRSTVRFFTNLNATYGNGSAVVTRYGYDSLGNESAGEGWQNDLKHPVEAGVYAQGRIDIGGAILRPSLRVDLYSSDAETVRDPSRPLDPDHMDDAVLDSSDLEEAPDYCRVSPRLSLVVPVCPFLTFHGLEALHYDRLPYGLAYTDWNAFASRVGTGSYYDHVTPLTEPQRTRESELGVTAHFHRSLLVDAVLYSQTLGHIPRRHFTWAIPYAYYSYASDGEASARGLEVTADFTPSDHVRLAAGYSWSRSKTSAPLWQSTYNIAWQDPQTILVEYHTPWDRPHRLSARGSLNTGRSLPWGGGALNEVVLTATALLASGTPYTPTYIRDEVSGAVSVQVIPAGPPLSCRMPSFFQVDVRLEKTIRVANAQIVPFLIVSNLLDRKNAVDVYSGTGMPEYCGYANTAEGQAKAENSSYEPHTGETLGAMWLSRYTAAERNPQHYAAPRQVYFGLRASF